MDNTEKYAAGQWYSTKERFPAGFKEPMLMQCKSGKYVVINAESLRFGILYPEMVGDKAPVRWAEINT